MNVNSPFGFFDRCEGRRRNVQRVFCFLFWLIFHHRSPTALFENICWCFQASFWTSAPYRRSAGPIWPVLFTLLLKSWQLLSPLLFTHARLKSCSWGSCQRRTSPAWLEGNSAGWFGRLFMWFSVCSTLNRYNLRSREFLLPVLSLFRRLFSSL